MKRSNIKLFKEAISNIKLKNDFQAIEILRQLFVDEPTDSYVKLKLAKLLIKRGTTRDEGKEILLSLENTSLAFDAKFELGRAYASEGNCAGAEKCFKELVDFGDFYALLELGRLYMSQGKNSDAEYCYNKILEDGNSRDKLRALLELGKLRASEGKNDEAKLYFEKLLDTPSRKYALFELGRLYMREGNDESARIMFSFLVDQYNDSYSIEQLIYLDIKMNNLDEILDFLNKEQLDYNLYSKIKSYVYYKTGKLDKINPNNYYASQLLNYDEGAAYDHVITCLDENGNKKIRSNYNSDVNVYDLFLYVKERIKNLSPVHYSTVWRYIVSCDSDIAVVDGVSVSDIEVVVIPHTKDILTMYPINVVSSKKKFRL